MVIAVSTLGTSSLYTMLSGSETIKKGTFKPKRTLCVVRVWSIRFGRYFRVHLKKEINTNDIFN